LGVNIKYIVKLISLLIENFLNSIYFEKAATLVLKGSHTGQAIRNDGFFYVYQWVRGVAANSLSSL